MIWPLSQFARKPWEGWESGTRVERGEFERRVRRAGGKEIEEGLWNPGR